MYKEIDTNRRRTVVLLGFFFVLLIGLGWALSSVLNEPIILPVAVGIAMIQAWSSYYYSDQIALSIAGARPLATTTEFGKRVHRAIENAGITAGLPKPRIYLIEDQAINAFATGRDPEHAAIAVTRGAVERLDKRQLEGVLAHEMSHIGNYDIRVMTIVVVLVGIIVLASDFFFRMSLYGGRRDRDTNASGLLVIIAIALAILSPLFATLIQLAISRKREYLADATGALITRDPEGLAEALEQIHHDHDPLDHANNATAHLYIANPFKAGDPEKTRSTSWFANLFNTHPPIADRVKKLRAMA
ncbi:M48 family metallopeptidase [Candidatus Berkelbacteria bacterium]|nr:M48 family metallopeptidase [Candidatus Berkelbacteria bacterium]